MSETFNITIENTAGGSDTGIGTIVDEGNGDLFPDGDVDPSAGPIANPNPADLDDERPVSINDVTVNEGSAGGIVFIGSGAAEQLVKLSLSDVSAGGAGVDYGMAGDTEPPQLEYSDADSW